MRRIFFVDAIVALMLCEGYFCTIIEIRSHPALAANLDGGVDLVVADISYRVSARDG